MKVRTLAIGVTLTLALAMTVVLHPFAKAQQPKSPNPGPGVPKTSAPEAEATADLKKAEKEASVKAELGRRNLIIADLERRGRSRDVIKEYRKIVEFLRESFPQADYPEGHRYLANNLLTLGSLLYRRGADAEAEPILAESLAMNHRLYPAAKYPDGHIAIAAVINNVGVLYEERGKYAAAEPLYLESLAMRSRLYPASKFPDGHLGLAIGLNNLGMLELAWGDYAAAEPLLTEALAMTRRLYPAAKYPDGHKQLATALDNLALSLKGKGDDAAAEPLLTEALAMNRRLYPAATYPDGHPNLAAALNNMGTMFLDRGDYAAAEPLLTEALAMNRRLYPAAKYPDGHPNLARNLTNVGNRLRARGDLAAAEPLLTEALAMTRGLYPEAKFPNGHRDLARGLTSLGTLYFSQGEYTAAEPLFRESLAMTRKLFSPAKFPNGHRDLTAGLNNLGALLQGRGDYAAAEPLLTEALAMTRRLYPAAKYPDGHRDLTAGLNNLGTLMLARRNYANAELLLTEALAMTRRLYPAAKYPDGHRALASALGNLGSLMQQQRDYAKSELLERESLAMYRRLYPAAKYPDGSPELANQLTNLAALLIKWRGDAAAAEPLDTESLAMRRRLYPPSRYPDGHPELAFGLNSLSVVLAWLGDYATARTLSREAITMEQRFINRESESLSFVEALNLSLVSQPRMVSDCLTIERHLPEDPSVYDLVWNAKGSLTRLLERRHRDLLAGSNPETQALSVRLNAVRERLSHTLLRSNLDPRRSQDLSAKLTGEKERLEREIAGKLKLRRGTPPAGGLATPKELSKVLPNDTAFIDVLRNEAVNGELPRSDPARKYPIYTAFILLPSRLPERVELGPAAAIDAAWSKWRAAIVARKATPEAERLAAAEFSRLTWDKLRARLPQGTKSLYLGPDGIFTQVPFAALPGSKSGTVLLEEMAVAVVPHGPFLLDRLTHPPLASTGPALVVGDVDYGVADSKWIIVGNYLVKQRRPSWGPLPGTAVERDLIAKIASAIGLEVRSLGGSDATTDLVLRELPGTRFAHLATHGFFADAEFRSAMQLDERLFADDERARSSVGNRNPLTLSGLVFAGANRNDPSTASQNARSDSLGQGIVTGEGLIGLNLDGMELAVLSACDTGLGAVAGGEGVLGLVHALHVAGCRDVIASLWSVEDEATAALMTLFYDNLWRKHLDPPEALRQAQLAIYHDPALIAKLGKGRGVDFTERPVAAPPTTPAPPAVAPPGPRAKTGQWAAFTFSGVAKPAR